MLELVDDHPPTLGHGRLLCIDGPAGSGKTTLAAALAGALEPMFGTVPVVHGDELYEGWAVVAGSTDRVQAFDLLAARVDEWLLDRWRHGWPASHPRWDWHADRWGDPVGSTAALPGCLCVLREGGVPPQVGEGKRAVASR